MPLIPLDDPIFAPDPPVTPGNRTPLDVMVETAANEEQNILAAMYNNSVQEVASPPQKWAVTRPLPGR